MKRILISEEKSQSIIVNLQSNTVLGGTYVSADYDPSQNPMINQVERLLNSKLENKIEEPKKYITNTKIISTYDEVIEHFKLADNKYFVTGITNSKSNLIGKYFKKNDFSNTTETLKPTNRSEVKKYGGDVNNKVTLIPTDNSSDLLLRTNVNLTIPGLDISGMILSEGVDGILEYVLYLDTENPIKYVDLGNGFANFTYMRSHIENENTSGNIILYDGFIEEPKIISEVFIDRGINSAFESMKKLKNINNMNELIKSGLGYYKINTRGYDFKK